MYGQKLFASANVVTPALAILLFSLLGVVCPRRASSQASEFMPSPKFNETVSVRELQVSGKAKEQFARGLKSLHRNDPESGLKQFEAAIKTAPEYYEAYYHKGIAEAQLGKNKDALQSFQAATNLSDGHYPRAEFGYALALAREGRAAEAERVVRHGLQAAPNIADGHVVLGVVLLELHRTNEAEQCALDALALQGGGAEKAHLILADVRAANADWAGQSHELEAYLAANPKDRHRDLLKAALDAAKQLAKKAQIRHHKGVLQSLAN